MLTYSIVKITQKGEINWPEIPAAPIDRVLWLEDAGIRGRGQVCYNRDALFVHLSATEEDIRAEVTTQPGPVYEDSCLEFFFRHEDDPRYFNFEINPNGCIYTGYGLSVTEHETITVPDIKSVLDIRTGRTKDGWEVFYAIPLEFLREYSPNFRFEGKLMANLYKCGNKTVHKHFLSWSPIGLEKPNFHCPEFFSEMRFA